MFDFEIEDFISLKSLQSLVSIDPEDFDKGKQFLSDSVILRLDILHQETREGWRTLAIDFENKIKALQNDEDESLRVSYAVNRTRGNHLNYNKESEEGVSGNRRRDERKENYLMLVSRYSEGLG